MQYSPNNDIMYVSMVDAGTVEFLRSIGKQIVSSADLVSQFEAVLTDDADRSHGVAQRAIDGILAEGWQKSRAACGPASGQPAATPSSTMCSGSAKPCAARAWSGRTAPTSASTRNCSDSHYEPTAEQSAPIREGDFLLIDIWGQLDKPDGVFYDITWTGVVGREPTAREQLVFETVRNARDAAIATVEQAFAANRPIRGYEADDAARNVIRDAGFGDYFTHRTGHNIAHQIHGPGAHLDNLETHDVRLILPNTCFSVEPGIYLPNSASAAKST